MPKPIVFLGLPGSPIGTDLATRFGRAASSGHAFHALSLDAPLENKPVTVTSGAVFWEGVDLLRAGAIFVERPVFPWPQPQLPPRKLRGDAAYKLWIVFQREANSLVASAIAAAAEVTPVVNAPAAVHVAVSPALALDLLARQGLRIHPWALEPAPLTDRRRNALVIDACGRDRWHSPDLPQPGEFVLVFEAFSEEVVTFLVVGEKTAGAIRYRGAEAWARRGEIEEPVCESDSALSPPGSESVAAADRLARDAAKALDLHLAAVSVRTGPSSPAILLCDASPDLAAWRKHLGPGLAAVLSDHLISLASHQQ